MTDYRWILRERTAAAHQRVDLAIGEFSDRAGYVRYLQGLLRFRRPIEDALRKIERSGPLAELAVTELAESIASDLEDLDAAVPPTPTQVPDISEDGLVGVLYVLEGSALGARVLLRRAEALGLSAEFGARHLALAARGRGWGQLLELMGRAPDIDLERATLASLATFDAAHSAFAGTA